MIASEPRFASDSAHFQLKLDDRAHRSRRQLGPRPTPNLTLFRPPPDPILSRIEASDRRQLDMPEIEALLKQDSGLQAKTVWEAEGGRAMASNFHATRPCLAISPRYRRSVER